MNSRKLAGVSAASVGAATAVAALLLGTLSGSAEEPSSSAFGLAAEGLLPISPLSRVDAPGDGHKALLEVPGPDSKGIYVGVLKSEAQRYETRATALKVDILGLRLKVLTSSCHGNQASSEIIKTDDGDKSSPYAGQQLNLSPIVKVEFNRQTHYRDRVTVDAAVITLLPSERRGQVLTENDLKLFSSLASSKYKVPTMEQVQQEHAKSKAPAGSLATAGDLLNSLKTLNPAMAIPTQNGANGLESVTVASCNCQAGPAQQGPAEQAPAAPAPAPVQANLPVTH
ncbi:MAG TPA: hypothetical protein VFO16_09935 [Pseudonocardiaceae bacterium]|nr:hypothetical protein [Pseudonocardiaceae bacterium]